jgi:7,8-dihydropterin-6-yl-methyl-4-(beta-D-ribofuranosyl)aminobenzene 5'-phosphate synthase
MAVATELLLSAPPIMGATAYWRGPTARSICPFQSATRYSAMSALIPVDRLDVQVVVENLIDTHSSTPANVEHEQAGLLRRGILPNAEARCCAVHGLSFLATARRNGTSHTVLFDAGPETYAFERNVARLGIDLGKVEAVVQSHGHWDHCGAMPAALALIRSRSGGRELPCYAHPDMFRRRATRLANGGVRESDGMPTVAELAGTGARMVITTEPQVILDDMFCVSGEIPRVTPYEVGIPGQVRRTLDGQGWEPDELVRDERYIAVHVRDKGLVVLSACSHAGIVNVLTAARDTFGVPLHTMLGGLHLGGANERIIPQTVEGLRGFDLTCIAAGHCTGWHALAALNAAFGNKVVAPLAVGKRYMI